MKAIEFTEYGSPDVLQIKDDMVFLTELFEAGKVVPVIDRRYPLGEVADAL